MVLIHYIEAAAIIPLGDFVLQDYAWAVAGIFALCGSLASFYNIALHLAHWTRPVYQLWIVRVLFIVPIYATISFVSIHEEITGLYMEILRDCYEAFVIYCFLVWILSVIGGEQACAVSIAQRMSMKHPFPLCCLPPMRLNATFLRTCKQMTLQFVILKPITATISFLLLVIGGQELYYNSYWQLIMLTAYNVSYTLALYGLFLFYVATKDEMNSFSPVRKFLAVKSVVFMTYWQALFIPIIFGSEYSDKTNDFILCLEMVVFAFMHYRAFPWWEFKYRKIPIDKVAYDYTNFGGLEDMNDSPVTSPKHQGHKQKVMMNDEDFNDWGYTKFSAFGYGDGEEKDEETDSTETAQGGQPQTVQPQNENQDGDQSQRAHKRSIDEPEIEEELATRGMAQNSTAMNVEEVCRPRRRRKSSENLAIISEEVVTCKSWCSAFLEVINVVDVCDDAKRNFVTPVTSMASSMEKQRSYEEYVDEEDGKLAMEHEMQSDGTMKMRKGNNNRMLNATLLFDEQQRALSTKAKRKHQYIQESKHTNIELITKT